MWNRKIRYLFIKYGKIVSLNKRKVTTLFFNSLLFHLGKLFHKNNEIESMTTV